MNAWLLSKLWESHEKNKRSPSQVSTKPISYASNGKFFSSFESQNTIRSLDLPTVLPLDDKPAGRQPFPPYPKYHEIDWRY